MGGDCSLASFCGKRDHLRTRGSHDGDLDCTGEYIGGGKGRSSTLDGSQYTRAVDRPPPPPPPFYYYFLLGEYTPPTNYSPVRVAAGAALSLDHISTKLF